MNNFKVGDKVRIRGDHLDFTEELDGKFGTVMRVGYDDCAVKVDNHHNPFGYWMIWKENLSHA